jgi:phage tail protein X
MSVAVYKTTGGEMVDEICYTHYGHTSDGIVESVLAANPGLADYGPLLPYGVSIMLPGLTEKTNAASLKSTLKLWD